MTDSTDFWDPRNPVRKADRLRFYQRRRFVCGLHLDATLHSIYGCLLESQGAGKALRVAPLKVATVSIPDSIRSLLSQALGTDPEDLQLPLPATCDLTTLGALQIDLTLLAEGLLTQLMAAAGKASDQILAVCLSDPGLLSNLDGQKKLLPLLDAERLAFASGLNVIDQLPSKDFLSGGTGWPLSALPLWMLWADRSHPVARQTRLILECSDTFVATLLPPSDGLDAEYPDVEQQWMPGYSIVRKGCRDFAMTKLPEYDSELIANWNQIQTQNILPIRSDRMEKLKAIQSKMQAAGRKQRREVVLSSLLQYWLEFIQPQIARGLKQSESFRIVIVDSAGIAAEFFPDLIRSKYPPVLVSTAEEFQCASESHPAVLAATMGFLHVDQLPSNLPWITGADHPRILGRLTPGTPSRYRNLLIEMADYRPPVMKLREAV